MESAEAVLASNAEQTTLNSKYKREECIVALKVYDHCRQQICLDEEAIGPARAAHDSNCCGMHISEGEIIRPPFDAFSVTVRDFKLKKIVVIGKKPNEFRDGFWDVDLKYVFCYKLEFLEIDGDVICCIAATSVFTKRFTLFGSTGSDNVIASDILPNLSETLDGDPIVVVQGKAIVLAADIKCARRRCEGDFSPVPRPIPGVGGVAAGGPGPGPVSNNREVVVTIGLFTIVKLCRLVDLTVESRGFCVAEECDNISPLTACEFFNTLDFPFDVFSPPQKREFFGENPGVGGVNTNRPCGCGR
jgi:hypothetical protein